MTASSERRKMLIDRETHRRLKTGEAFVGPGKRVVFPGKTTGRYWEQFWELRRRYGPRQGEAFRLEYRYLLETVHLLNTASRPPTPDSKASPSL